MFIWDINATRLGEKFIMKSQLYAKKHLEKQRLSYN